MKRPVIILGAGGHAKVLIDMLRLSKYEIIGYTEENGSVGGIQLSYLGDDNEILNYSPNEIMLVNGVGSIGDNRLRKKLYVDFKEKNYSFLSVIHPSAIIAEDVMLDEGVQVMAGAIIQPGSVIGKNSIINTKVSIDHDCVIGDHAHIAPGATLSGCVKVEDDVHIGTGATAIQKIVIKSGCIVGAGAVVLSDVQPHSTVIGIPAREVIK